MEVIARFVEAHLCMDFFEKIHQWKNKPNPSDHYLLYDYHLLWLLFITIYSAFKKHSELKWYPCRNMILQHIVPCIFQMQENNLARDPRTMGVQFEDCVSENVCPHWRFFIIIFIPAKHRAKEWKCTSSVKLGSSQSHQTWRVGGKHYYCADKTGKWLNPKEISPL